MIKELSAKDIPECVNVIRKSFQTVADEFGFTVENAPAFVAFATDVNKVLYWMNEQNRPIYGYFIDGRLVGCYNLFLPSESECELGSLCVLPEYRHQGIGDILLNDALSKASALKCSVMKLSIVEENIVLRRWYELHGFTHTGTKKFDFFPFTCGYLERSLNE